MKEQRIETAEHVLPGHPDKLCGAQGEPHLSRTMWKTQPGLGITHMA
jgi:hypothetical protein